MSGTTTNNKFYIPVNDVSIEEALEIAKKYRKDSDGVIRLKSEPKPKK